MGIAAADASDSAVTDVDAGVRPVPAKVPPIPVASPAATVAAAALMAADAALAAASPTGPSGKVRRTPAVYDPGVTATTASEAPWNCASIADCIAATSAAVSGLAKVIWVVTSWPMFATVGTWGGEGGESGEDGESGPEGCGHMMLEKMPKPQNRHSMPWPPALHPRWPCASSQLLAKHLLS